MSATGSVSLANLRLSLVSTAPFVDFSAANTLTPYLGGTLTLTDSAGKTATATILSAGTGETLSETELVTNGGFSSATGWTGVSNGFAVADGKLVATNVAQWAQTYQTKVITAGLLLKGSVTVSGYSSGTGDFTVGNSRWHILTGNGAFTAYGVTSGTEIFPAIANYIGGELSASFDDYSLKQVLSPGPTGVVTSEWTVATGFNFNDAGGYTYTISTPSGGSIYNLTDMIL
jgi:hypothetical protein